MTSGIDGPELRDDMAPAQLRALHDGTLARLRDLAPSLAAEIDSLHTELRALRRVFDFYENSGHIETRVLGADGTPGEPSHPDFCPGCMAERLEVAEAEVTAVAAQLTGRWAEWLQQVGFPLDHAYGAGALPPYDLAALAKAWHTNDDAALSEQEWAELLRVEIHGPGREERDV
ncbi:hypothetical protein ACIBH1_45400 [Nonomuraea sp. NPDC050663]|uniref:hypothetical protein n=1 Tax=Nonomuraea sp. NPDC050663 TaxID=3364370 RepID=UPI0037A17391